MSDFNWNDHPIVGQSDSQKSSGSAADKSFSWNDHPIIGNKPMGLGEQLGRAAIDTIPYATMAASGILAGPETLGAGSIPAAAVGYAGGKSLANVLKNKIYGDDTLAHGVGDLASKTSGDLKTGAELEMGGQIIGAVPGLVKGGYNSTKNLIASKLGANAEYTPLANKDAVIAAAEKLGVVPPKAVLTDNPTYQQLESGLSQSGSLPAKPIRDQYNKFFQGVDDASGKIASLKTPDSDFSIGKSIKDDLTNQVQANKAPVSEMYKSIAPDLKNIQVDNGVVNKVFGNLKKNPIFQTTDGQAFLAEHKDMLANTPDLASLKELRSSVGQGVSATAAPVEQLRANEMQRALTSIRDNSVEALKSGLPKDQHGEIDNLINQIALADSSHAANVKDLQGIKSIIGARDVSSPSGFLSKLGDAKESDLAQRAANLDVQSLTNLKNQYPSVFEKAKAAKINDMISSATSPTKGFNENSFFKQYANLDDEAKDLIFSPQMREHIENLQTVKSAIPDKLGPSGTPGGQMMMDMLAPKRTIMDLGIKTALNHASEGAAASIPGPAVSTLAPASSVRPLLQLLKSEISPAASSAAQNLPAAASKGDDMSAKNQPPKPAKGPDKWANDGHAKLMDHTDDPEVQSQLQDSKGELMADPKAKALLIAASDMKPGTKAMEQILSKIKSKAKGQP